VGSEPVTQTRLAMMDLLYEVQITLMLLEQLPIEPPTAGEFEGLENLLEHRQAQVDARVMAMQGRLAGAMNQVRARHRPSANGVEIPG
jgi:hypothetical protein